MPKHSNSIHTILFMWQALLLCIGYLSLFLLLISRAAFFKSDYLSFKKISLIFLLKIFSGLILILIYSRFYTVRNTTDAFKYYDDAKVIYNALYEDPLAYFRITFGINSGAADLYPYYQKMNNWFLADDYTLYNDSRSVIRFNALVFPFSNNHYSVHIIFMCFLSLCGLIALFKTFEQYLPTKKTSLAAAIFLLPSVLFWGSGVLKEGLILFASGFLIYFFFRLLRDAFSFYNLLGFALFFIMMWGIKVHVLFALIPGFTILYWHHSFPKVHIYYKTLCVALVGILAATSIAEISEKYSPFRMLAQKQKDFVNIANGGFYFEQVSATKDTFYVQERYRSRIHLAPDSSHWQLSESVPAYHWSKGEIRDTQIIDNGDNLRFRFLMHLDSSGSKIDVNKLDANLASILKNIPQALVNTLFRPTIFESKNYLSLFAAIENLLLMALLLVTSLYFKKPLPDERAIFIFCLSFVFILFSIAGLTTPVLGALVRYKIPALPYLVILLLVLIDTDKLKQRFPKLKQLI